ncbi:MAG: hypothetical protein EBZ49_09065 [Proteobacteria bacterium]|nr:hypothetical protein [Pseudomonadota bacterium]
MYNCNLLCVFVVVLDAFIIANRVLPDIFDIKPVLCNNIELVFDVSVILLAEKFVPTMFIEVIFVLNSAPELTDVVARIDAVVKPVVNCAVPLLKLVPIKFVIVLFVPTKFVPIIFVDVKLVPIIFVDVIKSDCNNDVMTFPAVYIIEFPDVVVH